MGCGPLTQAVLHAHVSILVYSDLYVASQATWSYMHMNSRAHLTFFHWGEWKQGSVLTHLEWEV